MLNFNIGKYNLTFGKRSIALVEEYLKIAGQKPCYLFDLDGTLFDLEHRLHHIQKDPKDWDAFFRACVDDKPISHMMSIARRLRQPRDGIEVVYISGRSDVVWKETRKQLKQYALYGPLYMRKAGDHRPDYKVKFELLQAVKRDGYEPIMAFDDRSQVVQMWRENGIPCAQVAEGDF